jgi:hypothetical protein
VLKKLYAGIVTLGAVVSWVSCVYILFIRPWHLRWGAMDEEVQKPMLGDDLVPHPMLEATRAVTIRASAAEIWPWLVQMGYRRAGWYSYDFIDNDRIHVNRIIPELQHLEVGDIMKTDAEGGFTVATIDPNRSLVLTIRSLYAQISSAIVLDEIDERQTRLIMRLRANFKPGLWTTLYYMLFEPGDFVMMRKQLLGIKQRVERSSQETPGRVREVVLSSNGRRS